MAAPKLKVGCAGLGRMGKRHALHFMNLVGRAELVAVSTPADVEVQWAEEFLGPYGVTIYTDYDKMLQHPGLQAVIIASVTTVHAEQSIKAIKADKHVLCEKPLSTSIDISQTVVDAAIQSPHLKVMCGFSRRFDSSYRDAYNKIESSLIGRPSIFRSQTCDKLDPSGQFVAYAAFSGGIFVDSAIHDIDLTLWFFGQDARLKSVVASGITAVQPGLREHKDVDNAVGIIEFYGGQVAYLFCSRMMATGQEDATDIIGTKGKLTVNAQPQSNLVTIHGPRGIRREIPDDYFGRYEQAFVHEANEFTTCCLDDLELPMKLSGAVQALKIGCALQESLVSGEKIYFDEVGQRMEKAQR